MFGVGRMKFKIGQTVRLIKNDDMAAEIGATAVVADIGEWLSVIWKTKYHNQGNGGYYSEQFEPAIEVGEQLQFSFMSE